MTTSLIKSLRPTYAHINLERLSENIDIARKLSGADIIAIVKADGYGHGATEVSHHAYETCGVQNFGVATISEGFSLRESFRDNSPRIMVLGYVDRLFYDEVMAHNLIVPVFDEEIAGSYHSHLAARGLTAPVMLKLDSGMGRLGFNLDLDFQAFREKYPRLEVVHVMSHLSSSDTDPEYSNWQEERFKEFVRKYSDGSFDTSLYNSSAIANFSNTFELTRPGLFMYGYVNGPSQPDLKPVMSIRSKVVHVHRLAKGDSVSYNRTFKAPQDCWVGVVPIGYADGYNRFLSNKGHMMVDGVRCNVVGNVCMDMTMIDLSELGESAYGKEVEIMGDNITATDLARQIGNIEYEILCGISDRIPRIYDPL